MVTLCHSVRSFFSPVALSFHASVVAIRSRAIDTPDGIVGNDDCGQMSAWYIFATLGFYPVNPTSGDFVLGQPLVAHATVSLPNGKTLAIAPGKDGSRINGEPLTRTIAYRALMRGGVLRLSGAEGNHP